MGVVVHYERSLTTAVTCRTGCRDGRVITRVVFEGGRVVDRCGGVTMFTGPPPAGFGAADDLAPPSASLVGELQDLVAMVCDHSGGDARLYYTSTQGTRQVTGWALAPATIPVAVWAVTGHVRTASGRLLPVGWSGRGDGRDLLGDPDAAARLRWAAGRLERARPAGSGAWPVVFAPPAAALVLHEGVGHFVEGPYEPRVDLGHRLGVQIAATDLAADDDPSADGGPACYGFDSDGVMTARTPVVRDGVVVGQLHSLASAARTGAAPTGNGRASSAWQPAVPRVSNLVVAPGPTPEAELTRRVRHGLYVHYVSEGWTRGPFIEFRMVLAEWIRGGELTGEYQTGGRFRERIGFLRRLDGIGNRCHWSRNAMCGKAGQLLFDVGTCVPVLSFPSMAILP